MKGVTLCQCFGSKCSDQQPPLARWALAASAAAACTAGCSTAAATQPFPRTLAHSLPRQMRLEPSSQLHVPLAQHIYIPRARRRHVAALPLPMSAATASALRSALPALVLALDNGSPAACEDAAIQLCVLASNAPADAREDVLVAMACSSELVDAVRGFSMCRSLVLCNTFLMLSCGRWADQHRVGAAVACRRHHRMRGLSTLLYLR